ncbi:MAG: hypothetical protein M1308_12210, partial [Actinobacteria bacterium]|nr:hypothetical protein [Actinomycetota bacterium]
MEKLINYFKSRKYTLSLFAGLFLVLIIFLIVLSFFFPDYRNSTSTNFSNFLFSPLQKTQIGITTGKDLDKIPIIK